MSLKVILGLAVGCKTASSLSIGKLSTAYFRRKMDEVSHTKSRIMANSRKGKAHENRTKEGPRTGVRTSGKTNSTPG